MPDPLTVDRLRSSVLSAVSLKELQPNWSDAVIDEWLNMLDNMITMAGVIDIEIDQKIEEVPTDLPENELIAPSEGFLVSTGVTIDDIESRSFFLARIY